MHWSAAFIKAVFGYTIELADLESVDPELYTQRIQHLETSIYFSRDGMTACPRRGLPPPIALPGAATVIHAIGSSWSVTVYSRALLFNLSRQ